MVVLAVTAIVGFGIWNKVSKVKAVQNEYGSYLRQARDAKDLKLIPQALEKYEQAREIDNNLDLVIEISQMYQENNLPEPALNWAELASTNFGNNARGYAYLLSTYIKYDKMQEAFILYDEIVGRNLLNQESKSLYNQIEYRYATGFSNAQKVFEYANGYWLSNTALVGEKERWQYYDAKGLSLGRASFVKANGMGAEGIAASQVKADEDWGYFDTNGLKHVALTKIKNLTYLGQYKESLMLIADDFEYGYYNKDFERQLGPYVDATEFNNGIAFVQENDKLWYVIKSDGSKLIEEGFDKIITDQNRTTSKNGSFMVQKGNQVFLYTYEGQKVDTEKSLEDAKLFKELDGLAAVKVEGKWGFMDKKGKIIIEPQFKDAKSFSHGVAAVQNENGKWGMINRDEYLCVPYEFFDILPMNEKGVTFVADSEAKTSWKTLTFYKDDHKA